MRQILFYDLRSWIMEWDLVHLFLFGKNYEERKGKYQSRMLTNYRDNKVVRGTNEVYLESEVAG